MKAKIIPASAKLMPVIQNMARFYAYDLSKSCGFYDLYDWSFPENGLYEALDISKYWEPNCHPFIIQVDDELAGFVLINKIGSIPSVDWNMGEFFIVGKFQGKELVNKSLLKFSINFLENGKSCKCRQISQPLNFGKKLLLNTRMENLQKIL